MTEYTDKPNLTDHEEGKLFWQHRPFSKLTYQHHMDCFDNFLPRQHMDLEASQEALKYFKTNKTDFEKLLLKYQEIDLIFKTVFYLGRKEQL